MSEQHILSLLLRLCAEDDIRRGISTALERLPALAAKTGLADVHAVEHALLTASRAHDTWTAALQLVADGLVVAVFCGVLQRQPTAQEMHLCAGVLLDGGGLDRLIGAVAASDEALSSVVQLNANRVVIDAFQALLGRAPSNEELDRFAEPLGRSGDINALLYNITGSPEFLSGRLEPVRRDAIGLLIDGLATTTGHGPDAGLVMALTTAQGPREIIESLLTHFAPDLAVRQTHRRANPAIRYRIPHHPRLECPRELALAFLPSEAWLPFGLAVADRLREDEGCETVFVWEKWSPAIAQATALSGNVFDTIALHDLQDLPDTSKFSPRIIVSHSYGWVDQTASLLRRFPHATLLVYGDAFNNEVRPEPLAPWGPIDSGYFFGFIPDCKGISARPLIRAEAVHRYIEEIAAVYQCAPAAHLGDSADEDFAVVYLRYWGIGPYALPLEDIVSSMAATIIRALPRPMLLILKNDQRAPDQLMPALRAHLAHLGLAAVPIEDYLRACGVDPAYQALPAEYLFAHGLLSGAKLHIVFDSSLSYLISTSRHVQRPTEIAIGGDLSGLTKGTVGSRDSEPCGGPEADPGSASSDSLRVGVLDWIARYATHYAQAVLRSVPGTQLLETDGRAFFRIRLDAGEIRDGGEPRGTGTSAHRTLNNADTIN